MPQDASHGEKLLKLYIHLLNNGGKHYVADLPDFLGCTRPNIYNLIEDLKKVLCDSLEEGKDGRRKWYRIKSYNYRNLKAITSEELNALHMCKDVAKDLLPEKTRQLVENTILSLSCMLKETDFSNRHNIQQQKVWFNSKGYIDYSKYSTIISTLSEAIISNLFCFIKYQARDSDLIKEYFYAPSRIICMNNAYYLLGHKVAKENRAIIEPRTLAIHRIKDVISTNQQFSIKFNEDDLQYFGLKWHEPKTFEIFFTSKVAGYITEREWSPDQHITPHDNGCITLRITTTSEPELKAWVRSFGNDAALLTK